MSEYLEPALATLTGLALLNVIAKSLPKGAVKMPPFVWKANEFDKKHDVFRELTDKINELEKLICQDIDCEKQKAALLKGVAVLQDNAYAPNSYESKPSS